MTDPVKEAIAAAQTQAATAAAAAPPPAATTAIIPTAGNAIANVGPRAPALSMEQLSQGTMSVDKWVKVTEHGLTFGDSPILVMAPIKVRLDMTEGVGFTPKQSIKGGKPAQYASSYNGVNAHGGGTWPDAIKRIRALAPQGPNDKPPGPYPAVDLPMVLVEDLKVKQGDQEVVLAKAGDRLGYSTSTTNWGNWTTFYGACKKAGLLDRWVELEIGAQRIARNQNVWGVMTFKLIGEAVIGEE